MGESPTLGKFGGNFGRKGEMMEEGKKGREREKEEEREQRGKEKREREIEGEKKGKLWRKIKNCMGKV